MSSLISIILFWFLVNSIKLLTSLHISDDVTFINRQKRRDHPNYTRDSREIPVPEKFQYLSNFVVLLEEYFQEYNESCNLALHKDWSDPTKKSILSGGDDSFQMNDTWRRQVCNFFKYLDCVHEPGLPAGNGICRCASPEKVGMKLYFDPFVKYTKLFDPDNKGDFKENRRKFRFWCRANEGGLCGYVRLIPNKTLPGIDFPYPDVFPCLSYTYDETRDNVSSKFDWNGREELMGTRGLICDHRQMTADDVTRLKEDDPNIAEGLDVEEEKVHAFMCRKKVEDE